MQVADMNSGYGILRKAVVGLMCLPALLHIWFLMPKGIPQFLRPAIDRLYPSGHLALTDLVFERWALGFLISIFCALGAYWVHRLWKA
jgi:hypothetical protein